MPATFDVAYIPGDKVHIDGCTDRPAIVIGYMVKGPGYEAEYFQVAWVFNNTVQEPWIEAYRLSPAVKE